MQWVSISNTPGLLACLQRLWQSLSQPFAYVQLGDYRVKRPFARQFLLSGDACKDANAPGCWLVGCVGSVRDWMVVS